MCVSVLTCIPILNLHRLRLDRAAAAAAPQDRFSEAMSTDDSFSVTASTACPLPGSLPRRELVFASMFAVPTDLAAQLSTAQLP